MRAPAFNVVVREMNDDLLQKGLKRIQDSMSKAVEKGKLSQADLDAAIARIKGTLNLADFKDCDLVIEAAVENMPLKKTIFTELDSICRSDAILASNTSSLCITEMAAATERPDKVLGSAFLQSGARHAAAGNRPCAADQRRDAGTRPSHSAKSSARPSSSPKTALALSPTCSLSLMRSMPSAGWMRGWRRKEEIDTTMKLGFNHPMGPFTLMDFVGLDTLLFIADAMYDEFKDARYAAPPLLRRMVLAGLWGRKSGRGFYTYTK